jgi:hypothetical protein
MAKSEYLHHLIKSLSKSEKRYFKIFASRHTIGEKNKYVELFDAIDKQEQYNEKIILKKFAKTKLADNLSSVKVHLTNLILKSLRQFNGNNKKKYDVRELIDFADILFEKGLYLHSKKILQKAKKIAYEYDLLILIDEISVLERLIAHKTGDYTEIQYQINEAYNEGKRVRQVNEMLAEYENILSRILALLTQYHRTRTTLDAEKYEEVMQHPLLQDDPENQPLSCQIEYHTMWGYYCFITDDIEKGHYHRSRVVKLLEQKPHQILDSPKIYIQQARRLLIFEGANRLFDEFDKTAEKLKGFIGKIPAGKQTKNLKAEIYTTIYVIKLDIDIDRGKFKEGALFAKEVEEGLKDVHSQMNTEGELVLRYNMFYVYFGNEQYHEALKWINTILNKNYSFVRMDIQCFTRLTNLLLHYELGNTEQLFYLLKSTKRFLQKNDRYYKFEHAFLEFVSNTMLKDYSKKELHERFVNFEEELAEIVKDPFESRALGYFDLLSWVQSKIRKCTFEEAVQERLGEARKVTS